MSAEWHKKNELLFPISERAVQKQLSIVCDALGYEGIGTHSFRKWYATEIYTKNGYDITLVQRLLQHSSAAITQRYIGIEPQRIEQAITEGRKDNKKMKPYLVYQYLLQESDENHVVSAAEIVEYIEEKGIIAERRSIYRDIAAINCADGAWDGVGNECCWYGCYDRKKATKMSAGRISAKTAKTISACRSMHIRATGFQM